MSRYLHIFFGILLPTLLLTSCIDDTRFEAPTVGDGDGNLEVTVAYDYDPSVELKSRMAEYQGGDAGNLIQKINTLYMVVYHEDGTLLRSYKVIGPGGITDHDPEIENLENKENDNRTDEEKANKPNNPDRPLQDISTGYVKYNMKLMSGRYYIYAVANVPKFEEYDISTRDLLKNISFKWQDNVEDNSQMFGVYTVGFGNRDADDSNYIVVPATKSKLHSWVRRLASKVTVAFDGKDLYDNVQVYITDISIKDIARQCKLGVSNRAGVQADGRMAPASKLSDESFDNGVIRSGKTITVQNLEEGKEINASNYYHVCNRKHPYLGIGEDAEENGPSTINRTHSPTARSLYFFENNQGLGKKKQQTNPNKENQEIWYDDPKEGDDTSGWKDNMTWGTYVEVTGFYRCVANNQHVSSGTIKYRFMLGQNDSTDYNAKRNTHYKLTLKLRGFGNDYDWHIDYKEAPGIHVTTPQYISYLYNKQMYITLKFVGELPTDARIKGEIDNLTSWKPWGREGDEYFPPVDNNDFYSGTVLNDGKWNAFLSLYQSNRIKIEAPGYEGASSYKTPVNTTYNKTYWEDSLNNGVRYYNPYAPNGFNGTNDPGGRGRYNISYVKDGEGNIIKTIMSIPIHTRAKELITATGYMGNNPYWEHPRYGRVNFSVVKEDGTPYPGFESCKASVDVIQVRRILNPKGVWRRSGSTEPFHVNLKHLLDNETATYTPVKSIGPWSAEVVTGNKSMITLTSTPEGSGTLSPQVGVWRIEGEAESPIDFNINFKGIDGCAIIKIRYHNYTCEHDIFVREGYNEMALTATGKEWSTFNVLRIDDDGNPVLTKNPLQEGSMFRRYSNIGIAAENSKNEEMPAFKQVPNGHIFIAYPKGKDPRQRRFYSGGWKDATWANLKGTAPARKWHSRRSDGEVVYAYDWEFSEKCDLEIATCDDYYELVAKDANDLTFPIQKAYGIVYADGASETLSNKYLAEGYDDEEGGDSPKGMRGVIVYNNNPVGNAEQIFFPIGMSGHGHRKDKTWGSSDNIGTMRYASRSAEYGSLSNQDAINKQYVPLFWDIYKRPGAIYWCKTDYAPQPYVAGTSYTDGSKSSAFDFNFFTMGFTGYDRNACDNTDASNSHACFIRTVKRKPATKSK